MDLNTFRISLLTRYTFKYQEFDVAKLVFIDGHNSITVQNSANTNKQCDNENFIRD